MHLSAPVQNWLESLPGFIGLEAQTLTVGLSRVETLLSRQWYILHYHRSTLLLPLVGEVVVDGGGVEGRSKVIYCIEGDMVIYYK